MSELPSLLAPVTEAKEAIRARIDAGRALLDELSSANLTYEFLDTAQTRFRAWDLYNELLLRRLFSGEEMETNYRHSKPHMIVTDLRSRMRAILTPIKGALSELEALFETLDLYEVADPTTTPEASTDGDRDAYFAELCRQSGGRPDHVVASKDIGDALGLADDIRSDVEDFLRAEGLIEFVTHGPRVCLTHAGRLRCERGIGASSTNVDQAGNTIVFMGPVSNATIQQAGAGASQSVDIQAVFESAREWVTELRSRLESETLTVPADVQIEITDLIHQAETELASDVPDRKNLKLALRALQAVLANTAGSLAASGLLAGLPELLKAL